MQNRIYLLDLEELTREQNAECFKESALLIRAKSMLDAERLQKVMRIRGRAAQAASLGAGLLIQMAVAERELSTVSFCRLNLYDLLDKLEKASAPAQLAYRYGECGKPYLQDIPMQFSLSHSGRYVLCAVSDREIGADIQQMRHMKNFRVAERFFASRELQRIMQEETSEKRKREFYRLWVRKESYGKLTGEGIAAVAGRDMEALEQEVFWEEYPAPEDYDIAVCQYR